MEVKGHLTDAVHEWSPRSPDKAGEMVLQECKEQMASEDKPKKFLAPLDRIRLEKRLEEITEEYFGEATFDHFEMRYLSGLAANPYCVTINALGAGNDSILIPGDWTQPGDTVDAFARITVNVNANQFVSGINFGWDPRDD